MSIQRSQGDESPIRVEWDTDGCSDLHDVTAIEMRVYQEANKTTLLETLNGEVRGFDPATYFPVLTPTWPDTQPRYAQMVLIKGSEDKPLPELITWTQS